MLAVNALIRVSAAALGQLLAFLIAEQWSSHAVAGSLVVGVLGMAFYVTELAGAPMAGRLADRYGPDVVLKWGPLAGAAAAVLTGAMAILADATWAAFFVLLVARLLEGSSAAAVVPTTLMVIARSTDGDRVLRTRLTGLFEMASVLGILIGFATAGLIWDAIGAPAFLVMAAVYVVAYALVPALPAAVADPRSAEAVIKVLGRLDKLPGARPFATAWIAVTAIVGLWVQFVPYLLRLPGRSGTQHLVGGYSGRDISVGSSLYAVAFLAGLMLWSWLGSAMDRRRMMMLSLAGLASLTTLVAIANNQAGSSVLLAALPFVVVASGFTPAAFAHLADVTQQVDASRGTALGLYSLFLGLGQLLGGTVGAPLVAYWQMNGVVVLTAVLGLTAIVGIAQMRPPVPDEEGRWTGSQAVAAG